MHYLVIVINVIIWYLTWVVIWTINWATCLGVLENIHGWQEIEPVLYKINNS